MSRILVAGNINHDCIWHLDRPLSSGARLSCLSRETRLGGGAYHTGMELLRLGATVLIAGTLMDDEAGRAALSALRQSGFDTTHVTMTPGATQSADILLDPRGERTIIAPPGRKRAPVSLNGPVSVDAIYVNASACGDDLLAAMEATPFSMAQFPTSPGARPADLLIGSAADLKSRSLPDLWQDGQAIAGERLAHLVITDGPGPVRIFNGEKLERANPPDRLSVPDTIGAGDTFAGALLYGVLNGQTAREAAMEACRLTQAFLKTRSDLRERSAFPHRAR